MRRVVQQEKHLSSALMHVCLAHKNRGMQPSQALVSPAAARAPHLHHAKAPLLAQHAGLVLHHVAEGGAQQVALLGHAAVEGNRLGVGPQPPLRHRQAAGSSTVFHCGMLKACSCLFIVERNGCLQSIRQPDLTCWNGIPSPPCLPPTPPAACGTCPPVPAAA